MRSIFTVAEDPLGSALADRLVTNTGELSISTPMVLGGAGQIKKKLPELTRLAYSIPVLILTDLDRIECAPQMRDKWLKGHEPSELLFRIAVRESESWLLADQEALAKFMSIPITKLTGNPDSLPDPKQFLLNLVKRHANKSMQTALLPEKNSKAKVGLAYNSKLIEFVQEHWCPERAARRSDSLARAKQRIKELA